MNWWLLFPYQYNLTDNPLLDLESTEFGFLKKNINYMNVCVHLSTGALEARGDGSPRVGVTGSCEPSVLGVETPTWVL